MGRKKRLAEKVTDIPRTSLIAFLPLLQRCLLTQTSFSRCEGSERTSILSFGFSFEFLKIWTFSLRHSLPIFFLKFRTVIEHIYHRAVKFGPLFLEQLTGHRTSDFLRTEDPIAWKWRIRPSACLWTCCGRHPGENLVYIWHRSLYILQEDLKLFSRSHVH